MLHRNKEVLGKRNMDLYEEIPGRKVGFVVALMF